MQFYHRGPDPNHPLAKLSEQEAINLCRDKLSGMPLHDLMTKYHISNGTVYAYWRAYKHKVTSQLEDHEVRITTLEQDAPPTAPRTLHTPACISAHASHREAYREMLSWEEHVLCGPYWHAETRQWLIMTEAQSDVYHAVAIAYQESIAKTK